MTGRVLGALVTSVLVVARVAPAAAHAPVFARANHDPEHAYRIDRPAKSWAIYGSLDRPDQADYYQLAVNAGDRLELGLLAARSPSATGFLPSFALLTPGVQAKDRLPPHVVVPGGYGAHVVTGKDPGRASYEPFSPGWLYELAEMSATASVGGTYYVVVFEQTGRTGSYALPVGYREAFTAAEWLAIPKDVHRIYEWEGQQRGVTYLPLVVTMIIGSLALWRRAGRGHSPRGPSGWLAALGGLAFLGSTVSVGYQMIRALAVTGWTAKVAVTAVVLALGAVLAGLTLRYALRSQVTSSAGRRLALVVLGLFGLIAWSGLYVGPALLITAALIPRPGGPPARSRQVGR